MNKEQNIDSNLMLADDSLISVYTDAEGIDICTLPTPIVRIAQLYRVKINMVRIKSMTVDKSPINV